MCNPFPTTGAFVRDLSREEILQRCLDLQWWGEIAQPLVVNSSRIGQTTIPQGFLTDGASVPRLIWAILSDTDPDILLPSYWHDRAYATQGAVRDGLVLTRDECDAELRDLMLDIGAPKFKADQVYFQLKLWGWIAWNDHKRHNLKLQNAK